MTHMYVRTAGQVEAVPAEAGPAKAAADVPALWFLHGFSDSSLAFQRLFASPLADVYPLYAPDLPGFGASPRTPEADTLDGQTQAMLEQIEATTPGRDIGLIGHSVGAITAVALASHLGQRCRGIFSIEGNLTAADAYFSGQAVDYDDADTFKQEFSGRIEEKSGGGSDAEIFSHYLGSIQLADAETMWTFGRDVRRASVDDAPGHAYRALAVPTRYYWAARNTPPESIAFLDQHGLDNLEFTEASHWPMIDITDDVAVAVAEFFG